MAGLLGANSSYTLPESKIGFSFPAEKLFHINGTPREDFRPQYMAADYHTQMKKAVDILKRRLLKVK